MRRCFLLSLPYNLTTVLSNGATIRELENGGWHLEIPPGPSGKYRVAQLDDYSLLPRKSFPQQAGVALELQARVCCNSIPGTWGVGFWNDPFGMGVLSGGKIRLPVLPNCVWFFFASEPNYLTLRDDLPASGSLAATLRSPLWHSFLLMGALPALPLLAFPKTARLLRKAARKIVIQDTIPLNLDPTDWHTYRLQWQVEKVIFQVDDQPAIQTSVSPVGKLGLVMWIDNQYFAFQPSGRIQYGTLANTQASWLEIRDLGINRQI